ncbi:MAG TPA: hypothetical protein VKB24_05545 [Candidatus Acidoferrum sp.]|nr:hypothetical protein [Candidatus Acidoferrum sp.]
MRITSSAPGRSKSTIKVEHSPRITDSSACRREWQFVSPIPSSSSVFPSVASDRLSWQRTAAA